MAGGLIKRYKWHIITILVLYALISFWLFFMTDSPQTVPFEYEVH